MGWPGANILKAFPFFVFVLKAGVVLLDVFCVLLYTLNVPPFLMTMCPLPGMDRKMAWEACLVAVTVWAY